jgi:hypothetical protein
MIRELAACGVLVLGDQCHLGEEHTRVPDRTRTGADAARKDANTPASSVRPPSTSTQLKAQRILRKLRCCPWAPGWSPKPTTFRRAKSEDGNSYYLRCP